MEITIWIAPSIRLITIADMAIKLEREAKDLEERAISFASIVKAITSSCWCLLSSSSFRFSKYSRAELVERFQAIDRRREFFALSVCEKYSAEIYFNYCSSCGALAVAPGSERCITCGFTWYGTNSHRRNS